MIEVLCCVWVKDFDVWVFYELFKLRVEVFVVEQVCLYLELDGCDLFVEIRYFWLEMFDGEVMCMLCLMEEYVGGEKVFWIGWLCIKCDVCGQGYFNWLLCVVLVEVGDYFCWIDVQVYLMVMYVQYGFVCDGDEFLDDGILYVFMLWFGFGQVEWL